MRAGSSKRSFLSKLSLARRSFLATSAQLGMRSLVAMLGGKQLLSNEETMNITTIPLDRWVGHSPEYKYDERSGHVKYIVMHSTAGIDSRDWLSKWNKENIASAQNIVSIHYLVQRDGMIYYIINEAKRAWHAGITKMLEGETDGNSYSIGVELEHFHEPDYTDAQLDAAAELVADIMRRYNIPGKFVVSHASIAVPHGRKIDPVQFDWADFWNRVIKFQEPINAPVSTPHVYTANSPTLHVPIVDENKITEYVSTRFPQFGEYNQADIRLITSYYIKYGKQTGIDWLFALAQCIHETGWFKSWWAARGPADAPRRNPGGIGVTGQTSINRPADTQNWRFDGKIWRKGQGFPSWDVAVQHHYARLLCYALKDEQMTPEQKQFITLIDTSRLAKIRGCAPTFVGFNGVWAVPGKTYAQTIAKIINSIVSATT